MHNIGKGREVFDYENWVKKFLCAGVVSFALASNVNADALQILVTQDVTKHIDARHVNMSKSALVGRCKTEWVPYATSFNNIGIRNQYIEGASQGIWLNWEKLTHWIGVSFSHKNSWYWIRCSDFKNVECHQVTLRYEATKDERFDGRLITAFPDSCKTKWWKDWSKTKPKPLLTFPILTLQPLLELNRQRFSEPDFGWSDEIY